MFQFNAENRLQTATNQHLWFGTLIRKLCQTVWLVFLFAEISQQTGFAV